MENEEHSEAFMAACIPRPGSSGLVRYLMLSQRISTFLNRVVHGTVMILLTRVSTTQDNFILRITVQNVSDIIKEPSKTKVLSYRWDITAVEFASSFNWEEALVSLSSTEGIYDVTSPKHESAKTFYDSILGMFKRTGITYLWVDQLCIPQNRAETMDIVHATGPFYQQFEVLIWVPWVLKTNEELEADISKLDKNFKNGDHSLHIQVAINISYLYLQCKRGWILREVSGQNVLMPEEKRRNVSFLKRVQSRIKQVIAIRKETDIGSLKKNGDAELIKGAGEAEHIIELFQSMIGSPLGVCGAVLQAARLTIAPFTVDSDRSVVGQMERFLETVNVKSSDSLLDISNDNSRYQTLLRLLTYVGTGAFRTITYNDFAAYKYSGENCKQILTWIVTVNMEFVSFSETLWSFIDSRLRGGGFTSYLPPNYPADKSLEVELSNILPFNDPTVTQPPTLSRLYIIVTSRGVQLKVLGDDINRYRVEPIRDVDVQSGAAKDQLLEYFSSDRFAAIHGNFS
jgi:hypothetical protein